MGEFPMNNKVIITLSLLLATMLAVTTATAAVTTTTTTVYAQTNNVTGGLSSYEFHQQLKEEHRLQQQQAAAAGGSSGEAMPSSRTTNMTNTTATQAAVTTQDPDFARFMQTASECANSATFGSSGSTMTQEQCTQYLEQGQEKWCGLAAYDAQKCAQTTRLTAAWNNLVNLSEQYGFSDIPSLGELGIDPRTIAPSP
jgi:hypothetical protein